ncbi:MAG: FAD binding domain-containing protein [Acidimicrobiia bacterium]|nr:FAD binding domain-containing protein [Acidimicrobiia bacterium]
MSFVRATTVESALEAMAAGARPLAGGSDLVVAARQGKHPLPQSIVAIDDIPGLSGIQSGTDDVRIGSVVRHAELETDPLIVADYAALADAAALVGSPATRNVGTLGGNIMNGSPAMDTGAPLMVLNARVELRTVDHTRYLDVSELWIGPGRTAATDDELCTAVLLPLRPERSGSGYVRLEYRRAMEIAVVGAAAAVTLAPDNDALLSASVALSAVAPTMVQVELPEDLVGRPVDDEVLAAVANAASQQSRPIADVRAGSDYRRHTVGVMAKRALAAAAARAQGKNLGVPLNRSLGIGAS